MEIHNYALESLAFQDQDYYDIDFWDGAQFVTKKILGSTIKSGILSGAFILAVNTTDDITEGATNKFNATHTGEVTGATALTITNGAVTNAKLALVPASTFKGSVLGGTPQDLTSAEATSMLNLFTDLLKGLVPASGGGTTNFLRADGTWVAPSGAAVNIYNTDGALTALRTLSLGLFQLIFQSFSGQTEFGGGTLKVKGGVANSSSIIIDSPDGFRKNITFQTGGITRWQLRVNNDVDGVGNTGSTLQLLRYDNAGAIIGSVVEINRSNGAITLNGQYTLPTTDGLAGQRLSTDGAGNVSWQTPTSEKRIGQDYAYNLSGAGGFTWNGITNVGTTALVTLLERWRLQSFVGTGQPDGCFTNFLLPNTYTAGNSIRVTIATAENGTGGNVKYWVGLAKPTAGNAFGSESTTEWLSAIHTAQAGYIIDNLSLVFSGTGLTAGEPISVMIFRDPADVQDTYAGDSYINSVSVEQL